MTQFENFGVRGLTPARIIRFLYTLVKVREQPMRHILQKGDMDCGIACVAMLAGVGYFEALEAFNDKESAVEKGNLAPTLRDALIKLGHQPAKRLTKFRGYDVLENDAILKVNPYTKGADWHWVVWDAERTRILDPRRPRPYVKHYRPVAVLTTKSAPPT
jgi:hypothetical protein